MAIKKPTKVPPKAPQKPVAPAKPSTAVSARPSYIPQQQFNAPSIEAGFTPALNIIQMISNELVKADPKYIEGAAPGMLYNTVTRELYDGEEGVVLIPLEVRKYFTEWMPNQGGFVAKYDTKEEMEASRSSENDVSAVYEFACVMEGAEDLVVVQFNSPTKYPVARQWAMFIQEAGTVCGQKYRLMSKQTQNKKKQAYFIWDIKVEGWATKEQYAAAEAIMKSIAVPQLTDEGQM